MLSGSFEVLRFPANGNGEDSEPPTVFSDLFTGAIYLDKPREVERYDASAPACKSVGVSVPGGVSQAVGSPR